MSYEVSPVLTDRDPVIIFMEPTISAVGPSPILDSMFDRWNPQEYERRRAPLHIGSVACRQDFSRPSNLRVLDMPIKFPGSNTLRVPAQLEQFNDTLQTISNFEAAINPAADDYYAYLTVDQRRVSANLTQRVSGLHVDGLQGKNVVHKIAVEQTYIVSDTLPTTTYDQPFSFRGKSIDTYNWFKLMEAQANPAAATAGKPYEIYLIDPYTVHAATAASENTKRTFLRLEFSLRAYDRIENTANPLFKNPWTTRPRPVDTGLL